MPHFSFLHYKQPGDNMKLRISLLFVLAVLINSQFMLAQAKGGKSPEQVKAEVLKRGTGEKAKVKVKLVLCPALKVRGVLIPPSAKPDPLTATCEIVMLDELELVTVSASDCVLPTVTLPKFKLAGFEPRDPAAVPLPESEIVAVLFVASLVMVLVALKAAGAFGVKENVIVAF